MSYSKIRCPVCEISIQPSFWARHCESQFHLKNIEKRPEVRIEVEPTAIPEKSTEMINCEPCKKSFRRDYYEHHIQTESHKRAVNLGIIPPENEKITCEDCGRVFRKNSIYSHRKSEIHQNALRKKLDISKELPEEI